METKLTLPPSIISPHDLSRLEIELHEYSNWFSHNAIKQHVNVSRGTPMPGLSTDAITMLRSCSQNGTINQQILDSLLVSIKQLSNHAPSLTITLAAPAGNETKQALTAWCRANIDPNILVSFKFNATILGGMILRCGSHIFDWSFRRGVLNNRYKFAEVLRRV